MDVIDIENKANEVRKRFNPRNLSPFPIGNVTDKLEDLRYYLLTLDKDEELGEISGITIYNDVVDKFTIFVNDKKPKTRQHFTVAHELGHYFLHKEILKNEKIIIDGDNYVENKNMLYRLDENNRSKIETEANCFAAALIMPEDLVKEAWKRLKNIQECASVFEVSVSAMSIRLERLGLV